MEEDRDVTSSESSDDSSDSESQSESEDVLSANSSSSEEEEEEEEEDKTEDNSGPSASISNQSAPRDIKLDSVIVDVCFHPSKDVIATGTISGDVKVWSYSVTGSNHELMSFEHHKKGCRAIKFSKDGNLLFTVSKDKTLQVVDMNTGKVAYALTKVHKSPVYSMLVIDDYLVATGDDDGWVKVFDFRLSRTHLKERQCEDYISDMALGSDKKTLLVTSAEGTLTALNVRSKKVEMKSEEFDDEFLSVEIVKGGNKVVVGSGDGALNIFNWGEWGNISDRFPGHPSSVDSILSITDDVICTGSFDGTIRAVNIHPNQFLGIVGKHGEYPIENMSLSHDKSFVATCSHDQHLKFWNIESLKEVHCEPNERPKKKAKTTLLSSKGGFFDDLE